MMDVLCCWRMKADASWHITGLHSPCRPVSRTPVSTGATYLLDTVVWASTGSTPVVGVLLVVFTTIGAGDLLSKSVECINVFTGQILISTTLGMSEVASCVRCSRDFTFDADTLEKLVCDGST
jgi:hypothetical protein